MRAHVIHNTSLEKGALKEIKEKTGFEVSTEKVNTTLKTYLNPYFNSKSLDFNWIRSLFTERYEVKCFVTSLYNLRSAGVEGHIGMYDIHDTDDVIDFYVAFPEKLYKSAKENGFKTNTAKTFVHEACHGLAHHLNLPDETHTAQDEGWLQEYFEELMEHYNLLKKKRDLLVQVRNLLRKLVLGHVDPVPRFKSELRVSQAYGAPNKLYPKTGHHIGVDYACPVGTAVIAPVSGKVIQSGYINDLGYYAYFKYMYKGNTFIDRLLHLSAEVEEGFVKQGEVIAFTGNTGLSTGPHIHIDTWQDSIKVSSINKSNWSDLTIDPEHLYKT